MWQMSLLKSFISTILFWLLISLIVLLYQPIEEAFIAPESITSSNPMELREFQRSCKGHTITSGEGFPLTIICELK